MARKEGREKGLLFSLAFIEVWFLVLSCTGEMQNLTAKKWEILTVDTVALKQILHAHVYRPSIN